VRAWMRVRKRGALGVSLYPFLRLLTRALES